MLKLFSQIDPKFYRNSISTSPVKFNFQVTIPRNCYTSKYRYPKVEEFPGNNTCKFSISEYWYPEVKVSLLLSYTIGVYCYSEVEKSPGNNTRKWFNFWVNLPKEIANFRVTIPGNLKILNLQVTIPGTELDPAFFLLVWVTIYRDFQLPGIDASIFKLQYPEIYPAFFPLGPGNTTQRFSTSGYCCLKKNYFCEYLCKN